VQRNADELHIETKAQAIRKGGFFFFLKKFQNS